jgi:hypothetical protein
MGVSFVKKYMTDSDIRRAIRANLIPDIVGDSPGRVVEEMTICAGDARVDLAVINGKLHGFEIKSDADTLGRLKGQISAYNRVFDTMTIICGERHLEVVKTTIPDWWGIYSVKYNFSTVELTKQRCAEINRAVCGLALAQLLWKSELAALLNEAGVKRGVAGKPCRELWRIVSNTFPTSALQDKVREILRIRADWRVAAQQV